MEAGKRRKRLNFYLWKEESHHNSKRRRSRCRETKKKFLNGQKKCKKRSILMHAKKLCSVIYFFGETRKINRGKERTIERRTKEDHQRFTFFQELFFQMILTHVVEIKKTFASTLLLLFFPTKKMLMNL